MYVEENLRMICYFYYCLANVLFQISLERRQSINTKVTKENVYLFFDFRNERFNSH